MASSRACPAAAAHWSIFHIMEALSERPSSPRWRARPREVGGLCNLRSALQGQVVAGVSGLIWLIGLENMIQKGELRGLADSSARRLAGVDIPTFDELGIVGLSPTNRRGVFAAPGSQDEDRHKVDLASMVPEGDGSRRALLHLLLDRTPVAAHELFLDRGACFELAVTNPVPGAAATGASRSAASNVFIGARPPEAMPSAARVSRAARCARASRRPQARVAAGLAVVQRGGCRPGRNGGRSSWL